jgi:predicted TIM-barrel enzyme
MTRPRKAEIDRRSEIIRVRLTMEESARLNQQADAAGVNLSDFVRSKVLNDEGISGSRVGRLRRLPDEVAHTVRTLSGIGVNLEALRQQADLNGHVVDSLEVRNAAAAVVGALKRLGR